MFGLISMRVNPRTSTEKGGRGGETREDEERAGSFYKGA